MLTPHRLVRLCRARDRLCDATTTTLPIEHIAREAGLSTGRFIRQFAAVFGETPHQRRIRARLDRAKLLLARDRSVTDVCFELGFSSLGSFSDLFTRRVGIPPSVYRRRLRPLVQVPGGIQAVLRPGCWSLMGAAFARLTATAAIADHPAISEKRAPNHGATLRRA